MNNNNINPQRSHYDMSKHSKTKSQVETASNSSDYSTCSDNPPMNMYWSKQKSRESYILAGQLVLKGTEPDLETNSDTVLDDTNFSINTLDLNLDPLALDVLNSENDVYTDCRNSSIESHNDSTMYLELGPVFDSKEIQPDISNNDADTSQAGYHRVTATEFKDSSTMAGTLQERLVTIIEEREITNTTDHVVMDLSPVNSNDHTGRLMAKMNDQPKTHQEQNNNTKKVLFVDLDNVEDNPRNGLEVKKTQKLSNIRTKWPRKVNDTCTRHNNTESFVLWENFCEASEKLASRRSFSFTELNTDTETCSGDDEYSTSYKTLDDMYLSENFLEIQDHSKSHQRMDMKRSKSCESLLYEVKHLPHLLYDRFLKCLSIEIEKMRKEKVVCTCPTFNKKNSNKENERKRSPKKSTPKLTNKINNIDSGRTESKLPLRVPSYTGTANKILSPKPVNHTHSSPTPTNRMRLSPAVANRTRLSPETASQTKLSPESPSKNLSQLQLSPNSPARTPTTPSKSRYFWNKQIVSPIGEYIRGKRPSPYQNPPNKKK